MKNLVSIVVLTRNKLHCTQLCLPTMLLSSYRPLELIVVDNASSDGTAEWLRVFGETSKKAGINMTLVSNRQPEGCSTARNQATKRAAGDIVVFADNDVAVRTRKWIEILMETLLSDRHIAMIGPKLVYPFPPYNIQCAGVGISKTGRVLFMGRGLPRDDPAFSMRRETQCLVSACVMARKSAVICAGGFDEAFNPVQFEDFDLCYKLRTMGWKIVYEPAAEMYHLESVTTAGSPELNNASLVIRHGLMFKKKWRHVFEKEDGPPDCETKWKKIQLPPFSSIDHLPVI